MNLTPGTRQVFVMGAFDDMRSGQVRFLEEAGKLGEVTALLWADELVRQREGRGPRFPAAEREYFLQAVRYVKRVVLVGADREPSVARSAGQEQMLRARDGSRSGAPRRVENAGADIPALLAMARTKAAVAPDMVVLNGAQETSENLAEYAALGVECRVLREEELRQLPEAPSEAPAVAPGRKRVIVTGCFDWVHSGHVRFFEEVSAYGDLYVVLGHDANIRLLKGAGHPLFPQAERRYVVGAIRYVTQALITTGQGWLDAEPEIQRLKPDIYAVNEDGDRGGKREYCEQHGIEYLVLKRAPAPGLPRRTSTDLRGF
jgi:cytidyltransferase-like protein